MRLLDTLDVCEVGDNHLIVDRLVKEHKPVYSIFFNSKHVTINHFGDDALSKLKMVLENNGDVNIIKTLRVHRIKEVTCLLPTLLVECETMDELFFNGVLEAIQLSYPTAEEKVDVVRMYYVNNPTEYHKHGNPIHLTYIGYGVFHNRYRSVDEFEDEVVMSGKSKDKPFYNNEDIYISQKKEDANLHDYLKQTLVLDGNERYLDTVKWFVFSDII